MSLRKKKSIKPKLSDKELKHLRALNARQAQAELSGLSPEHAAKMNEEVVFFKKGDAKGKVMSGGESSMVKIAEDGVDGTATYIEYEDKSGRKTAARTQITSDKKLIDENGNVIRELY